MALLFPAGSSLPARVLRLSFFSDIFPLLSSLVLMAALLYACYRFSRYAAKRFSGIAQGKNMRILERVALSQDKGLVIAEICGKYYVIAFSNERVEILRELDASEIRTPDQEPGAKNFLEVLNQTLKSRMEGNPDGSNRRGPGPGKGG